MLPLRRGALLAMLAAGALPLSSLAQLIPESSLSPPPLIEAEGSPVPAGPPVAPPAKTDPKPDEAVRSPSSEKVANTPQAAEVVTDAEKAPPTKAQAAETGKAQAAETGKAQAAEAGKTQAGKAQAAEAGGTPEQSGRPDGASAPTEASMETESPDSPRLTEKPAVKSEEDEAELAGLSVRERALRRSGQGASYSVINRWEVILPLLGGAAGATGAGILFGSALQDRAQLDAGAAWSRSEAEVIATRGMQKQVLAYVVGAASLGSLGYGAYQLYLGLQREAKQKKAAAVLLPMTQAPGVELRVRLP